MHLFAPLSLVVALVWAGTAVAQEAPAAAASAPNSRAQRDADKVFRMILMHADKPRRAREEKPEKTAAPVARAAPPSRPASDAAPAAAKPAEVAAVAPAITAVATPAPAPVDAGPAEAVTRPQPAPLTAVAAPALTPEPQTQTAPAAPAARNVRLELIESEEPAFPSRLVRSLGSGSVVVQFDVRPDGTVSQPEVVRSSHRGLNAAAVAAVSAWRFKPISETAPGVVELKFE